VGILNSALLEVYLTTILQKIQKKSPMGSMTNLEMTMNCY